RSPHHVRRRKSHIGSARRRRRQCILSNRPHVYPSPQLRYRLAFHEPPASDILPTPQHPIPFIAALPLRQIARGREGQDHDQLSIGRGNDHLIRCSHLVPSAREAVLTTSGRES